MKKYMLLTFSVIILIPIVGIVYWDFFFQDSLDNPDFTSTWTWFLQPEITIEELGNQIHISWFVLRSPMMQFSHFKYKISWSDIHVSGYLRPVSILFPHANKPLILTLRSGIYNVYYSNSDGSNVFIKSLNITY